MTPRVTLVGLIMPRRPRLRNVKTKSDAARPWSPPLRKTAAKTSAGELHVARIKKTAAAKISIAADAAGETEIGTGIEIEIATGSAALGIGIGTGPTAEEAAAVVAKKTRGGNAVEKRKNERKNAHT